MLRHACKWNPEAYDWALFNVFSLLLDNFKGLIQMYAVLCHPSRSRCQCDAQASCTTPLACVGQGVCPDPGYCANNHKSRAAPAVSVAHKHHVNQEAISVAPCESGGHFSGSIPWLRYQNVTEVEASVKAQVDEDVAIWVILPGVSKIGG